MKLTSFVNIAGDCFLPSIKRSIISLYSPNIQLVRHCPFHSSPIIIAIPILVGIALLLAGIVIVPILFYIGLVGVTIEAVKIIRRTDFMSLQEAREKGIQLGKPPKKKESTLRETTRTWESSSRNRDHRQHKVRDPEAFFRK